MEEAPKPSVSRSSEVPPEVTSGSCHVGHGVGNRAGNAIVRIPAEAVPDR
jgi:hypothetical protein